MQWTISVFVDLGLFGVFNTVVRFFLFSFILIPMMMMWIQQITTSWLMPRNTHFMLFLLLLMLLPHHHSIYVLTEETIPAKASIAPHAFWKICVQNQFLSANINPFHKYMCIICEFMAGITFIWNWDSLENGHCAPWINIAYECNAMIFFFLYFTCVCVCVHVNVHIFYFHWVFHFEKSWALSTLKCSTTIRKI